VHPFVRRRAVRAGVPAAGPASRGGDASAATDRQIAYRKRVYELQPDSTDAAVSLGVAQGNRAIAHMRRRERRPAEALLEQSLAALERAVAISPDDSYVLEMLANTLITGSELERFTDRAEASVPRAHRAIAILEGLIQSYPARPDYRYRHALAVHSLVSTGRVELQRALKLLTSTRDGLAEALRRNPDNEVYQATLDRIETMLQGR
jgi:hypothetical protein